MKKIYNDTIPFPGYKALTIWPLLFIRNGAKERFSDVDERHEEIHGEQQKEMLVIGGIIAAIMVVIGCGWWSLTALPIYFYVYGIMYIVRLIWHGSHKTAYRNIPFEQEAYVHQEDACYLRVRTYFAWVKFIFKTTYKNN